MNGITLHQGLEYPGASRFFGAHKLLDNTSALNRIARVIEGISIPAPTKTYPGDPVSAFEPFDYENVSLDYAGSCRRAMANLHRGPAILAKRKSAGTVNRVSLSVTKDQFDPLNDSC